MLLQKIVLGSPSITDTSLSSLMMWNLQSYPTTVLKERLGHLREVGVKTYSDPSYIIIRGQDPSPKWLWCASGCGRVPDLQSGGCGFESGLLPTKVYSAYHPSGSANEYQLRLGRQRQVWLIPIADERVGVQVKLWNPLRTHAIPERFCGGDSIRRGAISSVCTFTFYFLAPDLRPVIYVKYLKLLFNFNSILNFWVHPIRRITADLTRLRHDV